MHGRSGAPSSATLACPSPATHLPQALQVLHNLQLLLRAGARKHKLGWQSMSSHMSSLVTSLEEARRRVQGQRAHCAGEAQLAGHTQACGAELLSCSHQSMGATRMKHQQST